MRLANLTDFFEGALTLTRTLDSVHLATMLTVFHTI